MAIRHIARGIQPVTPMPSSLFVAAGLSGAPRAGRGIEAGKNLIGEHVSTEYGCASRLPCRHRKGSVLHRSQQSSARGKEAVGR
jgi:hypothetical protein